MLKLILINLQLLLGTFILSATNLAYSIDPGGISYHVEVYCDTGKLSFIEIKGLPEGCFKSYQNESLYKDSVYWLKITINSPYKKQADDYLIHFNCMISNLVLYEQYNDSSYLVKRSGVLVPLSKKAMGGYLKDKVPFSLLPNGKTVLYFRIFNELEYKYNLKNIEILSKGEYHLTESKIDFIQGCFIGMMFILAVVNFLLFVFSFDRLYLYYSLYLSLIALFFFSNFQFSERYLFFNYPKLDLLLYWSVFCAQFIYLLFFLQLLKNENVPIWRKYVKYYAWLSFIIYCNILIVGQINHPLAVIISDFYTLLNVVFIVASFFIFYRRVKRTTKLVLGGTLIMVTGALITTIKGFSQVSVNNLIYYQLGLFIEFVFFTIAVNYTYVKDRLEKVNVLYKNSVLKLEKNQKEQENKALLFEIDAKNRGLASKAMILSEKESLITNLVTQLNQLKTNSKDKSIIQGLINNLNLNLSNNSWDEFEKHFNEVHPQFYVALSKKYPNITASERKLCAFMKLNLSTKDIATTTGKSINTIDVARSRLRKKMGLSNRENLQMIIANIN